MGYQCIVCYERCKLPVSCTRCCKLVCKSHIHRFQGKCPNCRLQPFTFKEQKYIQQLIQLQIYKERQQMKKTRTFNCLVQGCEFEGKYHAIAKHRKRAHYNEKLEQIIYPEEREQKKKRNLLRNLLFARLAQSQNKQMQLAFILYGKTRGKCPLHVLVKLVQHLQVCANPNCNKVVVSDNLAMIGDIQMNPTDCINGSQLMVQF